MRCVGSSAPRCRQAACVLRGEKIVDLLLEKGAHVNVENSATHCGQLVFKGL